MSFEICTAMKQFKQNSNQRDVILVLGPRSYDHSFDRRLPLWQYIYGSFAGATILRVTVYTLDQDIIIGIDYIIKQTNTSKRWLVWYWDNKRIWYHYRIWLLVSLWLVFFTTICMISWHLKFQVWYKTVIGLTVVALVPCLISDTGDRWIPLTKGPVTQKILPFHDTMRILEKLADA